MWIYYLGCISLGAVAGLLVGTSSSPVVGVVLPLLFALLGGATGAVGLLPSHPNSERARIRFRIVGGAAAAVSIPFLLGTTYGILLRTGNSMGSLLVTFSKQEIVKQSDIDSLHVEDILDVYVLEAMLGKLGVEDDNKERVVRRFLDARVTAVKDYDNARAGLIRAVEEFNSLRTVFNDKSFADEFEAAQIYLTVAKGKNGSPSQHEVRVLLTLSDALSTKPSEPAKGKLAENRANVIRMLRVIPVADLVRQDNPVPASKVNQGGQPDKTSEGRFKAYPGMIDQLKRFENQLAIKPPGMDNSDEPDPEKPPFT